MKFLYVGTLVMLLFALFVGAGFAAGGGAGDALWADGAEQIVAPHSELWFRFDYGGNKNDVDVTLDANGAPALRMGIYTPQAVEAYHNGQELKEVGFGGPVQHHDLGWSGQFNFAGPIYVVVYNDGSAPAAVRVTATGENTTTAVITPVPTATPLPNPFKVDTPISSGVAGKIAFLDAQGGNLFTVNGDGTGLQRVSFGMDPQWNHTGGKIALARQGPVAGIFTINPDGSDEQLIYGTNEPRAPDWSPDDGQLVFSRMTGFKGGGEICFGARCFSLPATSQWRLGLLNVWDRTYADIPTTDHAFTPTWNSDGKTIAFNDTAIGIIKTSPDGVSNLDPFIGELRTGAENYDPLKILSPQYSPDGSKIVMMTAQPPVWQVTLANADGSDRHLLTQMNYLDFTHANNVAPVWSPDGKQIMFLSDRNGKWEIFVMNADGSNVEQVLKNVTDEIPLKYTFQGERMLSWTE